MLVWTNLFGSRMAKTAGKIRQIIGFDKDIQQIKDAVCLSDDLFEMFDILRFILRFQSPDGKQAVISCVIRSKDFDVRIAGQIQIKVMQSIVQMFFQIGDEFFRFWRLR